MTDIAIRVENLGKQYRIGALQKSGGAYSYKSLRDTIASAASLPFRAARALVPGNGHRSEPQDDIIWALKDVSFDVKHGEILGVIGRNGAGKSTLLKLLSRITEPTTGRAEIHGRVGSLLEVGTGFHPELTGRDNVFLNGAILGMKRAEIIRQFDAIVAFAEVEKFIDTPVKHYSSGMYLRLAFAVAAHLQTEILIVDEVLAVGDAEFQKKCLGKMQDVSRGGRTVLFVSHNMPVVKQLCSHAILLGSGTIANQGPSVEVVDRYLELDRGVTEYQGMSAKDGKPTVLFASIHAVTLEESSYLEIPLTIWSGSETSCSVEMVLSDRQGIHVGLASAGLLDPKNMVRLSPGENRFKCLIPLPSLASGSYSLAIQLARPWVEFYGARDCQLNFEILRSEYGAGRRPLEQRWGYGNIELRLSMVRD